MLPDDIVLKNCYYWAKRLSSQSVSFNELVSVGYVVGKPLKDARLLKDWIHHTMVHFIIDRYNKLNETTHPNLLDQIPSNEKYNDYSDLYIAIEDAKLSKREYQCVKTYFFEATKQKDIAFSLNIDQRTVAKYIQRALSKIHKQLLLKRSITNKKITSCYPKS